MLIFVYEYTCAALSGPAFSASLRTEGLAMLSAVLADFAKIDGVQTCTLLAGDFPQDLAHINKRAGNDERTAFLQLAREADYTLVIAPEFEDLLATRCQWVEEAGGKTLNASLAAIRLTADKCALAEYLLRQGVPTPPTLLIPSTTRVRDLLEWCAFPAVCKPRFGAGSQATFLARSFEDLTARFAEVHAETLPGGFILQPYFPGQPVSIAFLIGPEGCIPLWPAAQHLSDDGRFRYLGGSVPLPASLWHRVISLAERAITCIPGLRGYVGIDLILAEAADGSGDVVIEINPRLTTSYIGLRQIAPFNLVQVLLKRIEITVPTAPADFLLPDHSHLLWDGNHPVRFYPNGATARVG